MHAVVKRCDRLKNWMLASVQVEKVPTYHTLGKYSQKSHVSKKSAYLFFLRGYHPKFQRTARKDKKAFLSDQCKEIEENNRMGKTRDLFKKIRDTKGTLQAKTGSIKDRNGRDLIEAEDIKKRWQEYTQELYKKDLHNPDNHDGVITHLEPDILECEVKWALGSTTMNKASGGDGILVKLLQILKADAVKVLHSICQQIWKIQQWSQDWKSCFHSNPKERKCQRMLKLPQYHFRV